MKYIGWLALTSLLLWSCDDRVPCTAGRCPELVGTYAVSWRVTVQNDCGKPGPRPMLLTFTQVNDGAGTLVNGVQLGGSIFSNNDFALSGAQLSERYRLSGNLFSATGGTMEPDAGTSSKLRIAGTMTAAYALDGGASECSIREDFIGDKISR